MNLLKRTKHFLLPAICYWLSGTMPTVTAQTMIWARSTPSQSIGRAIATSDSGYVYTTGQFKGTVDFDPGPGVQYLAANADYDVFITKHDPNGNLIWARSMGGQALDAGHTVAVDSAGNVFVAGEFRMTAIFNPQENSSVMASSNSNSGDIFLAKLGASGALNWVRTIGGEFEDLVHSIAVAPGGYVIMGGEFQGTGIDFDPDPLVTVSRSTYSGSIDGFYCRFTDAGAFDWVNVVGSDGVDVCRGVAVDRAGVVYISGSFQNLVDFDPAVMGVAFKSSTGGKQAYMASYTPAGAFRWALPMGGKMDDEGYGIAVDTAGFVYATGYYTDTADFDPGAGTVNLIASGGKDSYICKVSPSATLDWAASLGGGHADGGYAIDVDDSGYVYTLGSFMSTADFDPGAGVQNLSSVFKGVVNPDIFISRLNTSGNYVWAGSIGGGGSDMAYPHGLSIAKSQLYLTGMYIDTADLDPAASDTFPAFSSSMDPTGFIVKLANCHKPVLSGTISGEDTICEESLQLYSIAMSPDASSYTWTLPLGWTGSSSTHSINVTAGSSGGTIQVRGVNACGNSASIDLGVVVNPAPQVTLDLTAIDTQCLDVTSVTLSGGLPAGGVYSGTTVNGGSFSPSTAGQGSYVITYRYTNSDGCSDTAIAMIYVVNCLDVNEPQVKDAILVYPNPFGSVLTVQVHSPTRLILMNALGEVVGHWQLEAGEHTLRLNALQPGMYVLQGYNPDGIVNHTLLKE